MKKWIAITDGGKYGVQPTMEKPTRFPFLGYTERMVQNHNWKEYNAHLLTRPRYLRTQGLELLPDGSEFAGEIGYEVFNCTTTHEMGEQKWWSKCTVEEYEQADPKYRRQVLAPLVKEAPKSDHEILGIAMSVARRVGELYGLDKSKNKLIGFLDGFHEGYKHRHIQVEALEELLAASKAPLKQSDAVEVERLKGLIEKAHLRGWLDFPEEYDKPFTIEQSWEKFKTEHNL